MTNSRFVTEGMFEVIDFRHLKDPIQIWDLYRDVRSVRDVMVCHNCQSRFVWDVGDVRIDNRFIL